MAKSKAPLGKAVGYAPKIGLRRAAELMRDGRVLMQIQDSRIGTRWCIVPGAEVSEEVARELRARSDVHPNDDGFFPGTSQTFSMR